MSRKGGYKIIDLKGLDFSSNMVIDGIHESIEDNYGKPLLFSGIVIDGVEKDDVFTNAVVNGDGYDVTLYGQTLHISNVDVISKAQAIVLTPYSSDGEYLFNCKNDGVYTIDLSTLSIQQNIVVECGSNNIILLSSSVRSALDAYSIIENNNTSVAFTHDIVQENSLFVVVKNGLAFFETLEI